MITGRTPLTHALVETKPARSWAPAVCRCGEESEVDMPSFTGREQWMRRHRREVAEQARTADMARKRSAAA